MTKKIDDLVYRPQEYTLRSPKHKCSKHGELQFAFRTDQRAFCPKCVADHLEKAIGVVRIEQ